ncbi:MAG: tRNA uridine-5-carboxymethylaminomethyl(34) synthesis GTPase MnmE [Candidatus Binatia bacterium]
MYRADTIVACATPAGRGAIAIVRCSGRDALAVSQALFRPRGQGAPEPWRMRLGTVMAADGVTAVDEALGVFFPAPHSFTGEDTFEVHCHGSPVVVEQVLASAIAAGARAADRGEFTRRAVLNGKLDLLQAEAIADLIDARMVGGAAAAWKQLQGALSGEFEAIRASLLAVLAEVEAEVDFTDDELPAPEFGRRSQVLERVATRLQALLQGFAASRRQREGWRVVFTGRPNAGKSSLVNRLLGSGRMIVSDEAGTTRDVVEETVDLGGVAFVLTDTAGIREAGGAAETIAVARALASVAEADLCVLVLDASLGPFDPAAAGEPIALGIDGGFTLVVLNKTDLGLHIPADVVEGYRAGGAVVLEASARTGQGCAEVASALVSAASERMAGDVAGISRLRHRAALEKALEPLERACRLVISEAGAELAAVELRTALAELSTISRPLDNEEVLDLIFSEFCIGK